MQSSYFLKTGSCARTFLTRSGTGRLILALAVACLPALAAAKAEQVNEFHWRGVERVIAIGDLHGDYEQYLKVLRAAGLVDARGKWSGGATHLVQTGDVTDRGPDSRKIIDHLNGLKKEAARKGGQVHTLVGNHEAMNIYGDLRYVDPGEFAAFAGKNSARFRELQWEHTLKTLETRDAAAFAALDLESFRKEWETQIPEGWVEHRQAWAVDGAYGRWVMGNPVVLQVNDTLFLHGGLSAKYCKASLAELSQQVRDGLSQFNPEAPGIVDDELGPLWYRGLANDDEALRQPMVEAILTRYGAQRIVVGHTPTLGLVWPRFESKVVLNDTGIGRYYGGYVAFLEIGPAGALAHYGAGSVPLPVDNASRLAYLEAVIALNPANKTMQSRLAELRQANAGSTSDTGALAAAPGSETASQPSGDVQADAEAAAQAAQIEAWLSPDNCR